MGKQHRSMTSVARFLDAMDKTQPTEALTEATGEQQGVKADLVRTAAAVESMSSHPSKRRKIGLLGPGNENYDATGLVTRYLDKSEVPERLKKYFAQRHRYFSLYAEGCLLDEEGWYSVTPEKMADQIAERCRCDTVLDAFCGVGGNAIAFAKTCNRVIAMDTSPVRLALARHNAIIYGVADRIEFILGDYLNFARSCLTQPSTSRKIDVIFLSPPWGGPSYLDGSPGKSTSADTDSHPEYSLDDIVPIPGSDLFRLSRRVTPNIAFFLPRTTSLSEIAALVPPRGSQVASSEDGRATAESESPREELIEIEEEYMGNKLKALTCYFGGLVAGQDELFGSS